MKGENVFDLFDLNNLSPLVHPVMKKLWGAPVSFYLGLPYRFVRTLLRLFISSLFIPGALR
ncbi:hypothetical protein METHPM2_210053 [Pseudomonas sp. PM2]